MAAHPLHQSQIISATCGNNEVSVWNMQNSTRTQAFWGCSGQPLVPNRVSVVLEKCHAITIIPHNSIMYSLMILCVIDSIMYSLMMLCVIYGLLSLLYSWEVLGLSTLCDRDHMSLREYLCLCAGRIVHDYGYVLCMCIHV